MNESSRHHQPPEQSPALRYGHYDFVGPEGLPPTSIERYLRRYLGSSFQLLYRVVDDEIVSINADEETVELLLVTNGSLSCKLSRSPSESTDLGSGDCVVMLSGETVVFEHKSGTAATVVQFSIPSKAMHGVNRSGVIRVASLPDNFEERSPTTYDDGAGKHFRRVILTANSDTDPIALEVRIVLLNPESTRPHYHPSDPKNPCRGNQLYVFLDEAPHELVVSRVGSGRMQSHASAHIYSEPQRSRLARHVAKPGDILFLPPETIHHVFGALVAVIDVAPAGGESLESVFVSL